MSEKLPKGIHLKKKTGGYEAHVHANGQKYHAGYSMSLEVAIQKRNEKRAQLGLPPLEDGE